MSKRVFVREASGECIELPEGETVVGRGLTSALRFPDEEISREHLRLVVEGGAVVVEDLHSSNGTLVNGEQIRIPNRLTHGDTIQLGTRVLRLLLLNPSDGQLLSATLGAVPVIASTPCLECSAAITSRLLSCPACGTPRRRDAGPEAATVRRRYPRYPVEVAVVYESPFLQTSGTALDLSLSGAFVASDLLDDVGAPCTVTLRHRGSGFVVPGVVRRTFTPTDTDPSSPVGMGIEFSGIDPRLEQRLTDLIDATQPVDQWYSPA